MRFSCKVLNAQHTQLLQMITVDKNDAYPVAMDTLKTDKTLEETTELRQSKCVNNVIEQDHIKHQTNREADGGIWVIQHSKTNVEMD